MNRCLAAILVLLGLLSAPSPARADEFGSSGAPAAAPDGGGGSEQPPEEPPPQPDPPDVPIPFRINSGSLVSFTDGSANTWVQDQFATSGNTTNYGSIAIAGTTDDTLYQTERWQVGGFEYRIPVNNGTYDVTTFHAENVFNASSARVFDILMEGVEVISNYDPYVDAGNAKNAAASETASDIVVSDGVLNIFYRAQTQNPQVNAIQITLAEPDAPSPPAPSCSPLTQSVETGVEASFTAAEGNGTFSWAAPSGTPATGTGSSFATTYSTAGVKTVTVTSGVLTATCSVSVTPPATFPEVLGSLTTAIETSASATAPVFRAVVGTDVDQSTEDTSDGFTSTFAAGDAGVVIVGFRDADAVDTLSNVTCGASAGTKLATTTNSTSGYRRIEIWGIPTIASANCVVAATYTGDGPAQSFITALAYTGVDSFGATSGIAGTTTTGADNWDVSVVTTRAASLVVAAGAIGNGAAGLFAPDDTETERVDSTTNSTSSTNHLAFEVLEAAAATVNTYNLGGVGDTSAQIVMAGIELRGTTGGDETIDIVSGGDEGDQYNLFGCSGGVSAVDTPAGWAAYSFNGVTLPNSAGRLWGFYRVSDANWPASETTVPLSMAADQETAWIMLVTEGHRSSTTAPNAAQNGGQLSTAAPDPPSLTTSSGVREDVLVLELFAADETSNTSPYASSGYTAVAQVESSNTAGSCGINVARKNVSATTEDPGVMAYGASEEAVAATIFIYDGDEGEAGSAPPTPPVCSPSSQTGVVNTDITFSATAGDGSFSWSAPGATTTTGSGPTFTTQYTTTGTKTVTVSSNTQTDTCSVTVNAAPPGGGGPGATGNYQVFEGRIYDPSGVEVPAQRLRGGNYHDHEIGSDITSALDYLNPSCWNIGVVRLADHTPGSAPPASYFGIIDDLLATFSNIIIIADYHSTPGPNTDSMNMTISTGSGVGDRDNQIAWLNSVSDKYGTRGTNPNERVWYEIFNEPGGAGDSCSGGTYGTQWCGDRVARWHDMMKDGIDAVRDKADAPIIIDSLSLGGDILSNPGTFNSNTQFLIPLPDRSSTLMHGPVLWTWDDRWVDGSFGSTTDNVANLIWSPHLYGRYSFTSRTVNGVTYTGRRKLAEYLDMVESRGQVAFFGEWGSVRNTNPPTNSIQASRNMRDLRIGEVGEAGLGTFYFMDATWSLRSNGSHHLTTTDADTNDNTSSFGIRDITGAGTPPNCTHPGNLEEQGEILWDGTH